jgi:hypothetical protein
MATQTVNKCICKCITQRFHFAESIISPTTDFAINLKAAES